MSSFRRMVAEPMSDLALLQREINQLFERLAGFDRHDHQPGVEWTPAVDMFECKGNLIVIVEVPGMLVDSLRLVAREGMLAVSGERRDKRPQGLVAFHCMERPTGRFTREIPVDRALDVRRAEARLERGLLTITIPRLKDRRGRETQIPVEHVE
jgi:HSP20 family protein